MKMKNNSITTDGIMHKSDYDSMIVCNKFDQLEKDCLFTKEQIQEIKHDTLNNI